MSPIKWVLVIGLGVVLGLCLWTSGTWVVSKFSEIQEDKRKAEEKKKADESKEQRKKESAVERAKFMTWQRIMINCRKSMGKTVGARLFNQEEYQQRLQLVGPEKFRLEEIEALEIEDYVQSSSKNSGQDFDVNWLIIVRDRLAELKKK